MIDLQLGSRVKQAGLRQGVLYGQDQVQLEWYTSLREFINGLMKNVFASFKYNVWIAGLAAMGTMLAFCLPVPIGLLSLQPICVYIALGIFVSQWCLFAFRPGHDSQWWYAFMIPFAGALMAFIIIRSAYLTLKNKGIYWRESFYPLGMLKGGE